tara:strand:+ start:1253 stop:4165 length:2913 start_codon:yes stop_codon:yes gene_type:complete
MIKILFMFLKLLFLILNMIFAGTTGKLTGLIIDENTSQPIIGCNIIIENTFLGTSSDQNGEYIILNIPPGEYNVRYEMIGYKNILQEGIAISIDKTTRLNINLLESVIQGEMVTVKAERKLIQFDVTQSEAIITSDILDDMPAVEVIDVLRLQGGVTQDSDGEIHLRGGRASEVSYMIDGVPVSDMYDGGVSVQIENDNVQELQVISGTFNAEYGKALTGVINMVTKDGGSQLDGSIHIYSGDYTTKDPIFNNLDRLTISEDYSISANISGPLLPGKISFYSSGRVNSSQGWLNGLQTFNIYGDTVFTDNNNNKYFDSGDENKTPFYKSLNWNNAWSTQNKLLFQLRPSTILKLNTILNSQQSQDYNHALQFVSNGQLTNLERGKLFIISLSHSFSPTSFFQFNLSQFQRNYDSYLFENPLDDRYVKPDSLYWSHVQAIIPDHIIDQYGDDVTFYPNYALYRMGVDTRRFQRETKTQTIKLDFTSQINKYNQIKAGIDYTQNILYLDNYSIMDSVQTDQIFTLSIPEKNSFSRSSYTNKPKEIALFLQDKIEYGDMIINIGLRYEQFDPNSRTPNNIHEPYINNPRNPALDSLTITEREAIDWGAISYIDQDSLGNDVAHTYAEYYDRFNDQPTLNSKIGWWKNTTIKKQLSPRMAVAYPISDKGVIHFAYGYFFKVPDYSFLYDNSEYKLTETGTNFGIFGNPDLKPETTVSYEIGLKQEVQKNTRLELRAFYRDARNYVSSGIPIDLGDGKTYYTYVNKDYANSRGIITTIYKRINTMFGGQIDYTYQIAEGANSNPEEEFGAALAGNEPTKSMIPLDWDQNHTLNGTIFASLNNWNINTIFQFGSGYPYTPNITNYEMQGEVLSNVLQRNSRRKPITFRLDIKVQRKIKLSNYQGKVYVGIYNLTDRRNQINVYGDTGSASETIEKRRAEIISPFEPMRPNTISEYFNRPDWYDPPRRIQFGVQFGI